MGQSCASEVGQNCTKIEDSSPHEASPAVVVVTVESQVLEGSGLSTDPCPVYGDITEAIGRTPLVKLNRVAPDGMNIYLKLESLNPSGSQQDRLALALILAGEESGQLQSGGTVIDATTGNTGIALATICAQRGYQFIAVMSQQFSNERRQLMRAMGAMVLCTPANVGTFGAVQKAEALAKANGYYFTRQFESKVNAEYHKKTTGPEIVEALRQKNIRFDYWFTGYGTGGTYAGVAEYIRSNSPDTKIVLCEPKAARRVSCKQGRTRTNSQVSVASEQTSNWKWHPIQGWTVNFQSQTCEDALERLPPNNVVSIDSKAGMAMAVQLAQKEGLLVGISTGAAVAAACEMLQDDAAGTNIVCMAPDSGDRYLSSPMFDWVALEMSTQEVDLMNSV